MESDNETRENQASDSESVDETEKRRIRSELSSMSFEDLQKLKQKIGAKVYNATVFGQQNTKKQTDFKRANKNRPRERSSKKRASLFQEIVSVKKALPRDPRFDPLCGTFDEKAFKSNYKFINGIKKEERKKLQEELQKTDDPVRKKKIKFLIQRLDNQIREQEKKEKQEMKLRAEREEIQEKLRRGEKPTFKKKSERKLEDLVEKYEELKKGNKLQKHMERRSKKLARKEFKRLPKESAT